MIMQVKKISSPAISGQKVYELISMLKEKQEAGVQITIVTWTYDSYGFGDAAYWMQLHEDMRKAVSDKNSNIKIIQHREK